jgi:hypothetical protein
VIFLCKNFGPEKNVEFIDLYTKYSLFIVSNEYFVVKIGFDTAENEPSKFRRNIGCPGDE